MTTTRDPDFLIQAFLDDGIDELPDSSYDVVRAAIDRKRQRVLLGPWRERRMSKFALIGTAAAGVVLAAVIGIRTAPPGGGIGGAPVSTASPAPSAIADPTGRLQPGTYVVHPFDTLLGMDARAFTFDIPSADWEAHGDTGATVGVAWNDGSGESHGVGLGFLKVHSLNSDACHWSGTDDDVPIGTTVDDLLEALASSTEFEFQGPYSEWVSNAMPQGATLTMPATLQESDVDCDEGAYRIWNAEGFDIYAQGPSNDWRLGIFEVDGERYVVMGSFMPDTSEEVLHELWEGIFRSVRIDPSPGCPKYSHTCD
jgi:hypothetical protein